MASKFTREIKREIRIRSSIRGVPHAEWILTFSERGLTVRRKGDQVGVTRTWRQVIGWFLTYPN